MRKQMRATLAALAMGGLLLNPPTSAQSQGQWRTHTDPAGFQVDLPSDWTAQRDPGSGRVDLVGPAGHRMAIQPIFLSGALLQSSGAASVLQSVARAMWPGGQWAAPQAAGPNAVRAASLRTDAHAAAVMTWVSSQRGTAAQVAVICAPLGMAQGMDAVFAHMLESFRIWSTTQSPAVPPMRFVQWTDPAEAAFSLEVPEGWLVEGGTSRPGLVGTQSHVNVTSPDGEIFIFAGDTFPVFTEPDPFMASLGYRPGTTHSTVGGTLTILPYLPGARFVTDWALPQTRGADGYEITAVRDRPDLTGQLNAFLSQALPGMRCDAGEVDYRLMRQGRNLRGGMQCFTVRVSLPSGMPGSNMATWYVLRLSMLEAPDHRQSEGLAALEHMIRTHRVDPRWAQAQQSTVAAQSQIISQSNREISQIIADTYEQRQATGDEAHRRFTNYLTDAVDVVDPTTGETYHIDDTSGYYWMDQGGNIVGTDTSVQPGPGVSYQEMINLDHLQ